MKSYFIGLGLCLQFVICHSQGYSVCIPTWTPYPRSYSAGGTIESSARQLQDCLARCERRSNCLAVDFRLNLDDHCWLHSEAYELNSYNFHQNVSDNSTQYRINRNCTDYGKDPECAPEWTHNASVGSYYGEQVNYWTEYDCFTYCRYTDSCVGVDFNSKTSPPCWIHRSDVIPHKAAADGEGVVAQYNLNKACPVNPTSLRIGRCVGQHFPTSGWCSSSGATINITDAWFRNNPLCCYRNLVESYPPDSLSLPSYKLAYFDPNYYDEINSSCGGQSVCNSSIRAKASTSFGVAGLNCPDGESGSNFVSIVYQCISDGSATSEKMTRRTTGGAAASATMAGTTKAAPSDIEQEARNDAATKENKNHLIIGLVVGFGVPLILAIVIVIVVLVRRRKQEWESEPKDNIHQVDNYFYNSETAPRGVVPENEQNEISMAVDSL